jgi:hypothetical protein
MVIGILPAGMSRQTHFLTCIQCIVYKNDAEGRPPMKVSKAKPTVCCQVELLVYAEFLYRSALSSV